MVLVATLVTVTDVMVALVASTDGKQTTSNLNILHVWVKNSSGWQLSARQAIRLTTP